MVEEIHIKELIDEAMQERSIPTSSTIDKFSLDMSQLDEIAKAPSKFSKQTKNDKVQILSNYLVSIIY